MAQLQLSLLRHYRGLLAALAAAAALVAIVWLAWPMLSWSAEDGAGVMMVEVEQKEFIHNITERGNIESARNVEIRSKVKSSRSGGSSGSSSGSTTILEIVPEGTIIKPQDCLPEGAVITHKELKRYEELKERQKEESKTHKKFESNTISPGKTEPKPNGDGSEKTEPKPEDGESGGTQSQRPDGKSKRLEIIAEDLLDKMVLVKLDSSSLETERINQQIIVHTSEASLIQARSDFDTAVIAKREYLEGTHRQMELAIKSKIFEAKENLRRAEQYLDYSKEMLAKGYVTQKQLEADEFSQKNFEKKLELAENELAVLQGLTKDKMVIELDSKIKTAEKNWNAEQARHNLKEERLKEIEEQFADCTIFATQPGQVVYANDPGHHGRGAVVIEEGTPLREHQVIIRLPDPTQMQVKAKISEGKISLVKVGIPATIRLDAFPDVQLKGKVTEVSEYASSTGWLGPDVKEFETIITILNPEKDLPEGQNLRPGMTAEVKIRVAHLADKLQVPVQAIIEHGGKLYCLLRDGDRFEPREVTIGASSDKFVVIEEGLEAGQKVVRNAAKYREETGLGEEEAEDESKDASDQPSDRPKPEPEGRQKDTGGGAPGGMNPAAIAGRIFKQADKNGNGRLEEDELPERMRSRFSDIDTDGDKAISREELTAAMRRFMPPGGGAGRKPPGAGHPPGDGP